LERGKPRLSALKRQVRLSCFHLPQMCGEFSVFSRSKGKGRFCVF
ncbi:hypothetical protein T07_6305, partial [Trichinella nelsoni]